MARTPTIRDDDLLDAARALFLEKGVRATTAEVAHRAGVSEGTLFKRFESKDKLFREAMRVDDELEALLAHARIPRSPLESVEDWFTHTGLRLVQTFRRLIPLVVMRWSNHCPTPISRADFRGSNPPPVRGVRAFEAAIAREMAQGAIKKSDAEVVARVLIGTAWHFVWVETVLGMKEQLPMPAETFIRTMTKVLFEGLAPEPLLETKARKAERNGRIKTKRLDHLGEYGEKKRGRNE